MTLRQVPVIDIAPFLGGDRDGKARVAAEVKQACEDIGFLVITGHGVDPALTGRPTTSAGTSSICRWRKR